MSNDAEGMSLAVSTAGDGLAGNRKAVLRRRSLVGIALMLVPAVLFQLSWGWLPVVVSIMMSFTSADIMVPPTFVGLDNFHHLVTDPEVINSFRVTFIYSGLNIIVSLFLPLLSAIFIMEMSRRVTYWMMFLWYLPLSSISTIMLYRYFYDPNYGLFQFVATSVLHLPPQKFLADPNQVLFWLVFPSILFFGPGLLYMAGLQGIPSSYFEAAEVEGASMWRKIWTITIPRLRPIIYLTLFLSIANSLQVFDLPFFLTNGEPGGASRTIMLYLYKLVDSARYGDATALSIVIFVVTIAMLLLLRVLLKDDPDA